MPVEEFYSYLEEEKEFEARSALDNISRFYWVSILSQVYEDTQCVIHHIVYKGYNLLLTHILKGLDELGGLGSRTILDTCDGLGNTPLMVAIKVPRLETVEILLKHHPNPNVTSPNDAGEVPLFLAIQWQYPEMVEAIALKCDDTIWAVKDKDCMTALHCAVKAVHSKLKDYMQEEYMDAYRWSSGKPQSVIDHLQRTEALESFISARNDGLSMLDLVLRHCLPSFHLHLKKEEQDLIYSEVVLLACANGDLETLSRLVSTGGDQKVQQKGN